MTGAGKCPRCGAEVSSMALEGQCPRCLAKIVFGHEPDKGLGGQENPAEPEVPGGTGPDQDSNGQRIGRYQVLKRIGEGGFGIVYEAEQIEPVRRRVALKIIKTGMDSQEIIARFEAERQALALMDHPNIARVLDGGTTEAGRPYFVMELVSGVPITEYCDQAQATTTERLQLMIQVCHAAQHAHQKGIIHRDLKPTNVLVTLVDGQPVPKVIDFGIAKALGQELSDKTILTRFEQLLGTPAYMSPEQTSSSSADIDTRSDIYSLGVLLYELLTGVTPFGKQELMKRALDEVRRLIRDTEPVKPSTQLQQLGESITEIARRRQTEPVTLRRLLRGDLDWITMKCLEKERRRRYETADGLAMDLERHLRNEPVNAAAPTAAYRARKFVARHRKGISLAGAFLVLLLAGTAASTWQAVRAGRAEAQARAEAAKSIQVAQFLKRLLASVGPSVALGRDTKLLREVLDQTSASLSQELEKQPLVEAELRDTLGETYRLLGEHEKARSMHEEALAKRQKHLGRQSRFTADSLHNLASVLYDMGKLPEAETREREALAAYAAALGDENEFVASSLNSLANILDNQHRLPEAEKLQRQALAIKIKLFKGDHAEVADSLGNLALTLKQVGKLDEAESLAKQALAMRRAVLSNDHPNVAISLDCLGQVLYAKGDYAGAVSAQREALALFRKVLPKEHAELSRALCDLGNALWRQGRLPEAEACYREAAAMNQSLHPGGHPNDAAVMSNLAGLLVQQGKLPEAAAMMGQALDMQRKLLGGDSIDVALSLDKVASLLERQEKPAEAEALRREGVAILEKKSPDGWRTFGAQVRLGANLLAQQKHTEAETLLTTGYEGLKKRETRLPAESRPRIQQAVERLVKLYEATGRPEKAEQWRQTLTNASRDTAQPPTTPAVR